MRKVSNVVNLWQLQFGATSWTKYMFLVKEGLRGQIDATGCY